MTATTANPLTLAQIYAKKSEATSLLKVSGGFALGGFAVAAAAMAFFPPLGIVGAIGAVIGISNAIDAATDAAKLAGLKKGEQELADGKTETTRKRADMLAKIAGPGRATANIAAAAILVVALGAVLAPALLPVAVVVPLITSVAWPALGLLAVSRTLGGVAKGAQDVVNAVDNPNPPAPPAAAAPEAAAKPSRFASLKKLFTRSAAPANDDAKPAAPEAKPAAPQATAPKP